MKAFKITVPASALVKRINRAYLRDRHQLAVKIARSEQLQRNVGRYFLVNERTGCIDKRNVDVEALARELGVLKAYEQQGEVK